MEPTRGYYNTFVVKIWQSEAERTVRGYIQHVGTQESVCLADSEKMANFMLSHLSWHINGGIGGEARQPLANPRGDESSLWEQF